MQFFTKFWLFFLILLSLLVKNDANFEENEDVGHIEKDRPNNFASTAEHHFRLKKYNKAWEKAQNFLNEDEQEKLFAELTKLDERTLAAKHEYASDGKDSSRSTATLKDLDRKLLQLLKNYQLYDVAEAIRAYLVDDRLLEDVFGKENDESHASRDHNLFGNDKNLAKLWQDAKSAGFSEEELIELRQEFVHYAQKQHDYHKKISDHADFENNPDLNSVLSDLNDENEPQKVDKTQKLKQENKLLQENFQNLMDKIENEKTRSAFGQFSNTKTKFLWEKALNSGTFNQDQLDSLKEELKHFDNRLNKLKFVEKDLLRQKFKLNKMNKDYEKADDFKKLHLKLKDHEKKAEKLEAYLKRKIEL